MTTAQTYGTRMPSDIPSFGTIFVTPEVFEPAPQHVPVRRGLRSSNDGALSKLTTAPSVVHLHDRKDQVKVRFRLLRRLPENHDREGAAAANKKTVDQAIAFVDRLAKFPPLFATLDDDGSAVIEFEDVATGFFADITFRENGHMECYARRPGEPSLFFEGAADAAQAKTFIENEMRLVLQP